MTQPADVRFASQQYQAWLGDLKEIAMLQTHNQSQAMMRAVLNALRDAMTLEQIAAFANALPPLPRGIFIEGWRPDAEITSWTMPNEFVADVKRRLAPHHVPPDTIVADVFAALNKDAADGSIRDTMRAQLPPALAGLWPVAEASEPEPTMTPS